MTTRFDLVVIGTGAAASNVAYPCRAAGWQIAVVDSRSFGGTCALRGCDPKKVLVGGAEVVDWTSRMRGKGIREQLAIDWSALMAFKRTFTDPVPQRREREFAKAGIATFHGRARFVGPTALQRGEDRLEGRYVVIASDAKPQDLPITGREYLTTSEQFLELNELPQHIVFVGGGYISFEFAHVAARAGARVTILHRSARPLGHFDPDLVTRLVQRTRELGVEIVLEAEVERIEKTAAALVVHASPRGERRLFEADMVVHGAGRVPEIDDLDLSKAGVAYEPKRGVQVNEYLQSVSNPVIYAAGDAAASGGPPLTPVAGYGGEIVAANLLKGNHQKANFTGVPSAVFTIPPLATVGLLEETARAQGLRFRTHHEETSGWYSSRRVGETYSGFKVLIEEGTDRILGANLLGPQAAEVINLFALAIRSGLKTTDLKAAIMAYPTHGSDIEYML